MNNYQHISQLGARIRHLLLILTMPLVFLACGEDPLPEVPTAEETVTTLLTSSTWTLSGVTVDGLNRTSAYAGLTINFSGNNFTTTNGRGIWPASGTWSFTSAEASAFTRNDGKVVTIQTINANLMRLSMQVDENSFIPGRTNSLAGTHVMVFER
ncbi:hypothetical protein [Mongoliitalea daihaiensis]|uniref:hypothetical protein n=1 Tax=Mongoliitalea daihaiensis TaxID=2782006 RepID=UPI001F26AEE5|nr:hypothetical protein [Mongoliitalea daihaiensis]UJP66602.1 hypothetical protein IPZ59_08430 [Mongoliitalea daihaiensis]